MAERAPNVAMLWCPSALPSGNWDAYYPGADVVDWAGVNLYSVTYFNQDLNSPASHVTPESLLEPFYRRYSGRHPVMVGEYGAVSYSMAERQEQSSFAARRISDFYRSLSIRFPRVKGVNYFSCDATRLEHRKNNDYTVTTRPEVTIAYREAGGLGHFLTSRSAAKSLDEGGRVISTGGRVRRGSVLRIEEYQPGRSTCIFLVDGRVQTSWLAGGRWHAEIQAEPGERRLTVEVVDSNGRTVGQVESTITVL
jgi:hypothetical protein